MDLDKKIDVGATILVSIIKKPSISFKILLGLNINNKKFIYYLMLFYSTVTDFAKLRGWSTSVPLIKAT